MTGYTKDIKEKMERLFEILLAIGQTEVLRKHLSLYGGTALNILHLKQSPRLSEDLDFNFRHFGEEDWGKKRDKIDAGIKWILDKLGYLKEEIRIQPQYNLNRFFIRYKGKNGKRDLLKIEIGYMRRIPDLKKDTSVEFRDASLPRSVSITTPKKEELFANKFSTMFSRMKRRPNAKDVFDVVTISKLNFNKDLFLDLLMIESILMNNRYDDMRFVRLNKSDSNYLDKLIVSGMDIEELNNEAKTFSENILAELEDRKIREFQSAFYNFGEVQLDLLKNPNSIHPDIQKHPQLLWLRKKYKKS